MLKLASATSIVLMATAALAADDPAFQDLSACRLDGDRVAIYARFDGSACEEIGAASVAEPEGNIASVVIPAEPTSEICTMQVVPVEAQVVVEVPRGVVQLDVAVTLAPENTTQARGITAIQAAGPECVDPEAALSP